ncbi:bromodomain-containing protein [Methylobrevis albus]|uniref:Uncharacterized protein n=1 Tax=Methylobrevis albus TaxID=2793297 RepID=A0A931I734_9HYPH|nr:hypothetical protein [Methylobrevis albus]MBH0240006.1 hypothetical protein [Methylobrevis albus]
MDPDIETALTVALDSMSPEPSEEFRRRFRKLCENALISNHAESEVRRVLELVTIDTEGES